MYFYEVVEQSLNYIENNIKTKLTLEIVAQEFSFSKYYFHRLFSAVMGVSLNNYILARKLNASIALIEDQSLSLTQVSSELYFSTPSSFSRAFKRQYGITPSELKMQPSLLSPTLIPEVIKRPMKNINGDIVSDFTISRIEPFKVSGLVFQVDLAIDDYRKKITNQANLVLDNLDKSIDSPGFVIYSDCTPNSSVFNVIVGIPKEIQVDLPYFFTVDVPELFCAQFSYSGNLLEMSDVLNSDYARFLKIVKQEPGTSHIKMIQYFKNIHNLDSQYQLLVPIKKMPLDEE